MDMVRRNTDYALRVMIYLARHHSDGLVSAREVSQKGDIPYQLACKLLQKLHNAKLVESCMGPKGGFRLSKDPINVSLLEVVKVLQGPLKLNRCLLGKDICPLQKKCKVRGKLAELEDSINYYLGSVTFDELVKSTDQRSKKRHNIWRKK